MVLATASALSTTSSPASNTEPAELHPAWASGVDSLEANLWANEPLPSLKWSRKLEQEPSIPRESCTENEGSDIRAPSGETAKPTKAEL